MEGSCCFVQKLALYASFSLNIHLSARFKSHCAVWVPPALDSANLAEHSVRRKPRGSIFSIRHAAFFQNAPLRHSACSARKTALFAAAPPFPVTPPRRSAARKLGRTRHLPKASRVHFLYPARGAFATCTDCGPGHVPHEKQLSQQMPRELSSLKIRFRTQTPP